MRLLSSGTPYLSKNQVVHTSLKHCIEVSRAEFSVFVHRKAHFVPSCMQLLRLSLEFSFCVWEFDIIICSNEFMMYFLCLWVFDIIICSDELMITKHNSCDFITGFSHLY